MYKYLLEKYYFWVGQIVTWLLKGSSEVGDWYFIVKWVIDICIFERFTGIANKTC